MHTEKTPLLIGLRAARANLIPGLVVQVLMVAIVVAYYSFPAMQQCLAVLAEWKRNGGLLFSAFAAAMAGGVLPEILAIVIFQRGRVTPQNWKNIVFNMCLWGFEGMIVDLFYQLQGRLFGTGVDFWTIVKKAMVDQFVYTPILATPLSLGAYEWKNQGYALKGMSRVLTADYYKNKAVPTLVANWGVWIPLVAVIYSMPPLLQFPLFTLGLTFWVMLLTYITSQKQKTPLSFSGGVGDAPPPKS